MEFLSCPEKSHAVRYTRGTFLAASSHAEVCFNQIDHLKLRKLSRKQLERLVSSLTMVYKGAEIEDMATIMSVLDTDSRPAVWGRVERYGCVWIPSSHSYGSLPHCLDRRLRPPNRGAFEFLKGPRSILHGPETHRNTLL